MESAKIWFKVYGVTVLNGQINLLVNLSLVISFVFSHPVFLVSRCIPNKTFLEITFMNTYSNFSDWFNV